MSDGPRRAGLSLRRLLALLLGVLGVLIAALFVVASLIVRGSDEQTRVENNRVASYRVADSMRQSSNDLTNMVRLYVGTGQQRYRSYYEEIIAIRAGTQARPIGYDRSFWDRVLAQGRGIVEYGRRESLRSQMRAVNFAPREFAALQKALDASNGLARLELRVMDRVERRIARGVDETYLADVRNDYRRLVDAGYLAEKGKIMAAIDDFIALVERRTLRELQDARSRNQTLARVQVGILLVIVLVGLTAFAVLSRVAVRPLERLTSATRRIAGGDYDERVDVRGVSELERVAGAFNDMAGSIQSDIAAREAAEREAVAARRAAEHANRAKSTFLAAMSHEIRTPMIGVTGMLEVLGRTPLSAQQRRMVATADSSARSLLQIIGDILDFSKIEADKLELAPSTFDLRALVGVAAETFVHTASSKGLLLTWSADPRLAPAHVGDPLRLRQIVSNLISNAVKFTEVGGIEVTVRVVDARAGEQTIELAVADTGIGIEPEQQQRLFGEFSQADATTAQRFGGSGLGLVICKRLAQLMGGDVTLQSAPGKGTTMRLTVPLPVGDPADVERAVSDAGEATSRVKPTRAEAEREGSVVLLAEDHPVNRTVLVHQLDEIGFHVDVAADGAEAFELFRGGGYGIVLTDLNMPVMDGYDLARAIRRHEQQTGASRTPIVALTASVMQGEPEKCRAVGMDDFAAKPTTIPFLAGRLRRWLADISWRVHAGPAGSADTAGGELVDAGALDALTGGDAALAAELLADFADATRTDLDGLRDAIAARDLARAQRAAHRMKGAALAVGVERIADPAQQVEARAGAGSPDWPAFDLLLAQIAQTLEELEERVLGRAQA